MPTATTRAPRAIGRASRVGTIDPMSKSRVYTDETLREVPAGSPEASFVWKRGELENLRDRRKELGLDENDDALRAQIDSRKAEAAKAERRARVVEAERDALKEAAASFAREFARELRGATSAAASEDTEDKPAASKKASDKE